MKPQLLQNQPNPHKSVTKLLLLAGFSCLMSASLFANSETWTGTADTNYNNSANWQVTGAGTGVVPGYNYSLYIINNGAVVNCSAGTAGSIYLFADTTHGAAPVMNLTGNYSQNNSVIRIGSNINNGGGIFNQTGGVISSYNPSMNINVCASVSGANFVNCTGTYNFGGTLAANPGVALTNGGGQAWGTISVGQYAGETGTVLLHDYGTINTAGVQSGSSVVTGPQGAGGAILIGQSGTGTFSVTGGHLTIATGTLSLGGNNSTGTAILSETIDSTGISTITAAQAVSLGSRAYFNLSLGAGFSATMGQLFTLISTSSNISGSFANLPNGGTYTSDGYAFLATYGTNPSNDTFTLKVTVVPEPAATLSVLSGLIGLGLTLRRRI